MTTKDVERAVANDRYLQWLSDIIDDPYHKINIQSYSILLRELYQTEFSCETAVLAGNDINRLEDAIELRREFIATNGYDLLLSDPPNLLEVMIAISQRFESILNIDTSRDDTSARFWELIHNLEFDNMRDVEYYNNKDGYMKFIDDRIEWLLGRDYSANGYGGFFPLKDPKENQRNVEIWYQMAAYINENYPF